MAVAERTRVEPLVYTDAEVEALKRTAARRLAQLARQGDSVDYKPMNGPLRKIALRELIVTGFSNDESIKHLGKLERRQLLMPVVREVCAKLLYDEELDR